MISQELTIDVAGAPMPAYLARPNDGIYPAIIVLEGVYGFDDEMRRVTNLVASAGYVGLTIDYFYHTQPRFSVPFSSAGRAQGEAATKALHMHDLLGDIAAARDWLNRQDFVKFGRIATWGFGYGGSIAFASAEVPGISGVVAFYGQSIAQPLPSGDPAPLTGVDRLAAPMLLIFGGADEHISAGDIQNIRKTLDDAGKRFEFEVYPDVGHSFFREAASTYADRQVADAWDRVQSFLQRRLK